MTMMFGIGGIGAGEWVIVFMVVLLLFGAKRIPEIMRSFGKGIKEFKSGMNDIQSEIENPIEKDEPPKGELTG